MNRIADSGNQGSGTRRTKIVATLGPATDAPGVLEKLVEAGLDVARFNLSHGSYDDHRRRLGLLREISDRLGRPLAAMADLQGPKIRVGKFADGAVTLAPGARFTITAREVVGDATTVGTTFKGLPRDVRKGDALLLHDGLIRARVDEVVGEDVICTIEVGGKLGSNQGINLPDTKVGMSALTEKDIVDVRFILEAGFDLVALSFVQTADDILALKKLLVERTPAIPVVAKIEKPQAIEGFSGILETVDAVMVARGDLGVELSPELVPGAQKYIISMCNAAGVPVITATEMLESMTQNARPTRAEASDVANAVEDGTDAVMLSAETASGKYPVEALSMMARICRTVDTQRAHLVRPRLEPGPGLRVDDAIAHAASEAAEQVGAVLIAAYTVSGHTARLVAKYRPKVPLVAVCPRVEVSRTLALTWGVQAHVGPRVERLDELPHHVERICAEKGLAKPGDLVVITAGAPLATTGVTNLLKIHRVGS